MKTVLFTLFAIYAAILFQRSSLQLSSNIHSPVSPVKLSANNTIRPYYTIGPIWKVSLPEVSYLEMLTRKKIDNFIFNHYNQYRFEFTFTDFGYSSNFMFSFFTYGVEQYNIIEKIGFNLNENIFDGTLNFDITKKNFQLTVRQSINQLNNSTITSFWLSLLRQNSTISANFTHFIKNNQCFTSIRSNNIISHKCFGGVGEGKIAMQRVILEKGQNMRRNSVHNLGINLTRTVYDGLRGSGMKWNWVWGIMSGFSKTEFYTLNSTIPTEHWIGLNLGHLAGEGEDFVFMDGKIIPIQGLHYRFNDKMDINQNIIVTAKKPKLKAILTVVAIEHKNQDLGVLKIDLIKVQGNWEGEIERDDGKIYKFYEIAGFIERSNSIF